MKRPVGRPKIYTENRSNLGVRLRPEIRALLEHEALTNRRSLSGQIEFIIETALAGKREVVPVKVKSDARNRYIAPPPMSIAPQSEDAA